jgi:hypothetical protein
MNVSAKHEKFTCKWNPEKGLSPSNTNNSHEKKMQHTSSPSEYSIGIIETKLQYYFNCTNPSHKIMISWHVVDLFQKCKSSRNEKQISLWIVPILMIHTVQNFSNGMLDKNTKQAITFVRTFTIQHSKHSSWIVYLIILCEKYQYHFRCKM